ncbi:hypothetical protein [Pyrococcus kukulkanii]|uniref:Uncharacterized protein n=1 Tax=Pyrococcus kukulkanii TaxID=1609559 RepID=A0A127B9Q1_9EURY|nr:hypothetical protein [Pyrococcus kukulkanii]AMM53499.1 hypothetical protein TQ32_02590 [Pyrococcus kukulkanii]
MIVYNIPQNLDPKTWAEVQKMWADVERERIKSDKEKWENIGKLLADTFYRYNVDKVVKVTTPVYWMMVFIVIVSAVLTAINKVSGDAFTFLMGTIAGYLISIVSKHAT